MLFWPGTAISVSSMSSTLVKLPLGESTTSSPPASMLPPGRMMFCLRSVSTTSPGLTPNCDSLALENLRVTRSSWTP